MPTISAEQVGAQVRSFWTAYCKKSGDLLQQMYLPSALVFSAVGRRSEPAQLMLARRLRKIDNLRTMNAELGPVDVQIAGDMAIASYPYRFHSTKTNSDGSSLSIDIPYSRGTQVFQAGQNGVLRILHEHLSAAEPGSRVVIPRENSQTMPPPASPAGLKPGVANAVVGHSDTTSLAVSDVISTEEACAAVQSCWDALRTKSKERLEAAYFPAAVFLAADARRSEPARLAIVRRIREFFGPESSVTAELSSIEVQVAGTAGVIASYAFHFHIVRRLPNGKCSERDVPFCRATAVLRRDETGAVRIFHEHQSATGVGSSKELPDRAPVLAR